MEVINEIKHVIHKFGGKVYRKVYSDPLGVITKSLLEGGPIQQYKTSSNELAMINAASKLEKFERKSEFPTREIYFMTGKKYWYQTLFCYKSLHDNSQLDYVPVLIDDGTMDKKLVDVMLNVMPWCKVILQEQMLDELSTLVPENKYPSIRRWRIKQPLTRKLTDLHGGRSGWKMLLDSDMLFFRNPEWLTAWMVEPDKPAYMVDCKEAYGYSRELRSRIAGTQKFPDRANIGIFGFRSNDLDLDWLEYALRTLELEEGSHYNITQGLTSMLFAMHECTVAPEEEYIVLPDLIEGKNPKAIMHHYVAHSKRSYFQYSWRYV